MNKSNYIVGLSFWLFVSLVAITVYSCANRGYPEGGPKDTTPPLVIAEVPVTYTKNFDKKRVSIYFNEFVQLKDVNEKFIISPPQKKKPTPRLKGKYVQVDFVDSLKPNTTYSLDFADAIVDNNEGNPLGFYRYVFSTGSDIDSLELSGNVVNAESGLPMFNMYVMLYENHADSAPVKSLPDYIARTDSSGFFRLTNLRDTTYRMIALEDNNRDYKFVPEGEMIAFLDTTVRPVVFPMVRTDTLTRIEKIVGKDTVTSDSIVTRNLLAYGPNNLFLRIFQEENTQLYMTNDDRKERNRLDFTFSIPGRNDLKAELWDSLATESLPRDWYITERSAGNDTIMFWIKDSTVYKKDTLNMVLTYLRTDSLGQLVSYADTSRYTFTDKKKKEPKLKKREEAKEAPIEFLGVTVNASGDFDLNGRLFAEFDVPVEKDSVGRFQLWELVDTLYKPVKYTLRKDSLKIRKFYLDYPWVAEHEYKITLDSAALYGINGRHNDKLEKKFKIRPPEYYGKVILAMKGVDCPVIVQMYKSESNKAENGKMKYSIVREMKTDKNGDLVFDFMAEGKYKFRAILDRNNNGKWDTGLYMEHRQPEEIIYLPAEINVKQNFDVEQEFNLQATYKDENEKE